MLMLQNTSEAHHCWLQCALELDKLRLALLGLTKLAVNQATSQAQTVCQNHKALNSNTSGLEKDSNPPQLAPMCVGT
jgi:hypothetical protein